MKWESVLAQVENQALLHSIQVGDDSVVRNSALFQHLYRGEKHLIAPLLKIVPLLELVQTSTQRLHTSTSQLSKYIFYPSILLCIPCCVSTFTRLSLDSVFCVCPLALGYQLALPSVLVSLLKGSLICSIICASFPATKLPDWLYSLY
jgi:hypothetical protein